MDEKRKLLNDKFIEKARKIHGELYDYSKFVYVNAKTKGIIICQIHNEFVKNPDKHLAGAGCPKCAKINASNSTRLTKEKIIERFKEIHGNKYDYSLVVYKSINDNIDIICPEHGIFTSSSHSHGHGNGCPKCGNIKRGNTLRLTTDDFIAKSKEIHGNKYDYSRFEYTSSHNNGIIICKIHGNFLQSPTAHLSGRGCSKCGTMKRSKNKTYTTEIFIEKAKKVHNNLYDYSLVEYINSKQKIKIICPIHGTFEQLPNKHLSGDGCFYCGLTKRAETKTKTTEQFIKEASFIHNNLYDYSLSEYIGNDIKLKIICPIHGTFEQIPTNHIHQANGCPNCSYRISKPETTWLDYLNVPLRQHCLEINGRKINVDGYDPETNTVYQFHGDYWHGNPEIFNLDDMNETSHITFKELYENTLKKDKLIRESGYKLVLVWESDYYKYDGKFRVIWERNEYFIQIDD